MIQNIIKTKKEKNGITLVALVITIVVMLIIAAITISMVAGSNGVLEKAKQSQYDTQEKEALEPLIQYISSKNIDYMSKQSNTAPPYSWYTDVIEDIQWYHDSTGALEPENVFADPLEYEKRLARYHSARNSEVLKNYQVHTMITEEEATSLGEGNWRVWRPLGLGDEELTTPTGNPINITIYLTCDEPEAKISITRLQKALEQSGAQLVNTDD